MNLIIFNNDDPSLCKELLNDRFIRIEEICMRAVKISIELAIVPIRKFLIIFYIYLRLLFTDKIHPPVGLENDQIVQDIQAKMPYPKANPLKNNIYVKESSDRFLSAETPARFHLQTDHPVENFYRRYMSNDQPIPQIIVVGILRVLLTTCPNNAKNAGGIDLHSEWGSCINLLMENKQCFRDAGFKSLVFDKTTDLLQAEDPKHSTEEEKKEPEEDPNYAAMPEYQFEMDRHRVIVAMIISDFFLFMLKHFKANHVVQFMYLSQLIVDANGVLVLLKFLNQDFSKIDFDSKLDKKLTFLKATDELNLDSVKEFAINSLLRLMYKTCKNQKDRIKANLVTYKATVIMKKLFTKFKLPELHKNAAKVIKIQIKYCRKDWRRNNPKIMQFPYYHVKFEQGDDWMDFESSAEQMALQE